MKVTDCIFFHLAKANQAGARFWSNVVSCLSLTTAQAMVLGFLGDEDEIPSCELGSRTLLDSATLTGILDRLEAGNFIERRPHPEDRRAIRICLTEKGRGTTLKIRALSDEANREFLQPLSSAEQAMLKELLLKVRQQAIG